MSPEERLWDVYMATTVTFVHGGSTYAVRPSATGVEGEWPFEANEVWIMTAENPRSVPLSDAENARRHAELGELLEAYGLAAIPADGSDDTGEWSEQGYLVQGPAGDVVVELAARYEQNAVFHWTPSQWSTVGVLFEGARSSGWTLRAGD